MFNLDAPQTKELNYLTQFAGWYIPNHDADVKLKIYLNNQPYSSLLHGGSRPDVAAAFPDEKNAADSGFWGELLLPATIEAGSNVEIEIVAESQTVESLYRERFQVTGKPVIFPERERNFRLEAMLRCPECDRPISPPGNCNAKNCPVWKRGNTFAIAKTLEELEIPYTNLIKLWKSWKIPPKELLISSRNKRP